MVRASPHIRSFNAGEVSPLVEGRTDLDRYPASNRKMLNYVAAPQGPGISRSGTQFVNRIYKNDEEATLIPFVFDDDTDFYMLEFSNLRMRIFTEDGLLTLAPVACTFTSINLKKFDSVALGASVGDEVSFSTFPESYNVNGVVAKITNVAGTVYTVDTQLTGADLTSGLVAKVYHIDSPYTSEKAAIVKDNQSLDVLYLTCSGVAPYKLSRTDTYSWAFEVVDFVDGPYLPENEGGTTLSPTTTGKHTPDMTTNVLPNPWVASGSSEVAGYEYYKAFDTTSNNTWWSSNVDQTGTLQIYFPTTAYVCDGYSIHIPTEQASASYTSKDYGPSDFSFEGSNDGAAWVTLDKQNDYVLYDSHKSVFFPLKNTTAYKYYRLDIRSCVRNGTIKPRVKALMLRSTASTSITINASAVTGINNDVGFLATDVGRLLRIRGHDGSWRALKITGHNSSTQVVATLLGEPFEDLQPVSRWRLGHWSDTTGYPNYSYFYQDRLWLFGSDAYPDLAAASVSGRYENMAPSSDTGVVLDTSAISVRLNSRKLARIRWAAGGKDGLLLGAGSQEFLIRTTDATTGGSITPNNIKADDSGSRGSSGAFPVEIDQQVLFVQRGGRTIREAAYNYEADGYKTPSMSTLSSHLGASPFVSIVYAAEPYSIVWVLREDGRLVGLTYNRDENVIGWHRHEFPDSHGIVDGIEVVIDEGFIECIAVLPSSDKLQDVLWMVVRRTVDGQTVRYVEKLMKFWDFNMTLDDAHYVDCALRYVGEPTNVVYGLRHLEGKTNIYGLVDGNPAGPFTVAGASISLPEGIEGSNIIMGIGFDGEGETSRLENGALDGTAQGKNKRIHGLSVLVWASFGGEVGTWNEDTGEVEYTPLQYPVSVLEEIETVYLFDGILGPEVMSPGYEKTGSVSWRRRKDQPLPFNIVAFMPQMLTQDR